MQLSMLGMEKCQCIVLNRKYLFRLLYSLAWIYYFLFLIFKSSYRRFLIKKDVLKNFAKFIGKHLYQSLFLNKFAGRSAILLKKRFWHRCFPVIFTKFLRTSFLTEKLMVTACVFYCDLAYQTYK